MLGRGGTPSMSTIQVAREFDEISPAYDSTREPLHPSTIAALAAALRATGVRRLLEVGVGTGRIASPLVGEGFEVTGIDASRGMLGRARSKGISRLVRGSAYQLPFLDGSFDATLFVHILHVLDEPERALREGGRVGRQGAFALVHPTAAHLEERPPGDLARRMLLEELRSRGISIPDRGGPMRREREVLARCPPARLSVLAERDVTESLGRRLDVLATRSHRWSLRIPPDVLEKALASVRERVGTQQMTYHRTEALAVWSNVPVAAPPS
jgi:ubiquinone/menaquinone biosynthesis C-methylase UbiE